MASPATIGVSDMTEEEFERRTLAAIHRELGPGGVARFLMAFRSGHGDYTAERQQNPDARTLDVIWRELEAHGLTDKP
jgi:hypothetical protein